MKNGGMKNGGALKKMLSVWQTSFVFAHNIHGSSNYYDCSCCSTHCDMSSDVNQADLIGDSHVGAVSRVASLIRGLLVLSTDHLFLSYCFDSPLKLVIVLRVYFNPFNTFDDADSFVRDHFDRGVHRYFN